MNRIWIIKASLILIGLFSTPAFAATGSCTSSTGLAVVAESTLAGGTAHLLAANGTNCSNLCNLSGFGRAGYIEFSDKQLFAHALSNSYLSPRPAAYIVWETGATAKGSLALGTVTCRIISISN